MNVDLADTTHQFVTAVPEDRLNVRRSLPM
jgi:hypothetical protein